MVRFIAFMTVLLCLMATPLHASNLLSERTYKKLERVHKLMDKGDYSQAEQKLAELQQSIEKRDYDKALVMQTFGYLYLSTNKPDKAIDAFKQALAMNAMPQQASQNIRLNLSQLYMEQGMTQQALDMYQRWIAKQDKPSPQAHVLGGSIYAQLKDYPNAIKHLKTALSQANEPKEAWFQLLLAIYFESGKYTESAALLEQMVIRFADRKQYWQQLAGVYFTLKQDKKALSVSQLAYHKGLLRSEDDILRLAKLYLYLDLPMQSAALLKKHISNNEVENNKDNLLLLSESLIQAREFSEAGKYLQQAAATSGDPELHLRLANIHASQENWPQVITALEPIDINTLDQAGKAHLLKGIAYYEQAQPEDAIKSLKQATLDKTTRNNAQQWLKLLSKQN